MATVNQNNENNQSNIISNLLSTNCPTCNSTRRIKSGTENGIQRFKCKHCGKHYRETTGSTVFRMHKKQLIDKYIQCMIEGQSLRKTAKETGISLSTAFIWRHKFLRTAQKNKQATNSHKTILSSITTKYSEKGNRNWKSSKKHKPVTSLLAFDSLKTINLKVLYTERDKIHALFDFDKASATVKDNSLPNLLKNSKESTSSNKALSLSNSYNQQILVWMKKFRGVATKYLSNYWAWYEHENYLIQKAQQRQSLFEKCLYS